MGETRELPVKDCCFGVNPFQGAAQVVYLMADVCSRSRFLPEGGRQFFSRFSRTLIRCNEGLCGGNGFFEGSYVLINICNKVLRWILACYRRPKPPVTRLEEAHPQP